MSSVLGTYARKDISFIKGKGCYLYTEKGEKYLDFVLTIDYLLQILWPELQ